MQITETSSDGLKREYTVVVPAKDIQATMDRRLQELGRTVKLPGFRPGKVPMAILKKRYGQSVMGEVLERAVSDSSRQAVSERGLRLALQPRIEVTSFAEGSDLEYRMAVEVLPDVEPGDFGDLELERPVAEVSDAQVQETLDRLAASRRETKPVEKKRGAKKGDVVVVDFRGTVDGEPREGMNGEGYHLELGSGSFIEGFEDQLVGAKKDEHRTVTVTFPENYGVADLAGKEAVFEVDVKELREPVPVAVDDEFAKGFGAESLDKLKEMIRDRIAEDYRRASRARVKRALLDALAERYDFPIPPGMVDLEFDAIWKRLQEELKRGASPEDAAKSEEELKEEYRKIAERRVRLGLLLSEVGRRHNVEVTQEELGQAVLAEARRFPGQERQVFEFFRGNPQAVESLRAPVFEDKVVDFILDQAKVKEKKVSPEELLREPEEAEQAA